MTKEEVDKLYKIWMFHRSRLDCSCPDHHFNRKIVCEREQSWRNYCAARDQYLGPRKEQDEKFVDVDALFDTFQDMGEN